MVDADTGADRHAGAARYTAALLNNRAYTFTFDIYKLNGIVFASRGAGPAANA
jgi:hypothetical protein